MRRQWLTPKKRNILLLAAGAASLLAALADGLHHDYKQAAVFLLMGAMWFFVAFRWQREAKRNPPDDPNQ